MGEHILPPMDGKVTKDELLEPVQEVKELLCMKLTLIYQDMN
jgi:hypothetical protein